MIMNPHIAYSSSISKIYKFPLYCVLFRCWLPLTLTMMHLRIMLYTYWTPLLPTWHWTWYPSCC